MINSLKKGLVALMLVGLAVTGWATPYELDATHSSAGFRVRHLVGKVPGNFEKFTMTLDINEKNFSASTVHATLDASSINTHVAKRDDHLRSADFFDVATFPHIIFTTTKITDVTEGSFKLHGDFSMHGITKPIILNVERGGVVKGPRGGKHIGFSASGKINRKDYGLTWNKVMEAGTLLVGEEVEIFLEIEAVEKK